MKKILITIFTILFILPIAFSEQAPYISFDLSEGIVMSDSMSNLTSYNVFADVGYIITRPDGSSYMMMYELIYQGPGLRPLGSESLAERNQDHYFLFKYMKNFSDKLTFKAKVNYLWEFYRLSNSEEWGSGLYDFTRGGVGFALSYKFSKSVILSGDLNFFQVKYPNYNDLFTEYITNQQVSEVKVDNDIIKFSLSLSNKVSSVLSYGGKLSYTMKSFPKQSVLASTGDYSSSKQEDTGLGLDLSLMRVVENVVIGGKISYYQNTSNQNVIDMNEGAPYFIEDYYSYSMFEINPIVKWMLNKKHQLLFSLSYISKSYDNRPSREEDGLYREDSLKNNYLLFSTMWNISVTEFLKVQPVYFYKSSSSNNDYSSFVNYNYKLHYLGINFLFEY